VRKSVIIDAGPLVAFFSKTDQYHEWAVENFQRLQPPLFTCEAVLSEACFLLSANQKVVNMLLQYVGKGIIQVKFDLAAEVESVGRLVRRYADRPMSLADACLVRMSETLTGAVVLTIDDDFRVYRRHSRKVIPLISPASQR